MTKHSAKERQAGFTIVELMIATSVLTTILLLVTIMMISIGNLFYKGVNQTQLQDDVRSVTDDVSRQLQFSDGPQSGSGQVTLNGVHFPIAAYCFNNVRYSFVVGPQLGQDPTSYQSPDVLWRDDGTDTADEVSGSTGNCLPINVTAAITHEPQGVGSELVTANSRLTAFSITGTSPYTVTVGMAFGDSSTLCDSGTTTPVDDCGTSTDSTHIWNPTPPSGEILCKTQSGDQFCATSTLTVNVIQRLTSGN